MTLQEIIEHCEKQLELGSDTVGFVLPGRWGEKNTKRLWPHGPIGTIVAEANNGVLVMFDVHEVLAGVTALCDSPQG